MVASHCNGQDENGKDERRLFVRVDHAILPILLDIQQYSELARKPRQETTGHTALAVYVALRSFANEHGHCWPKQDAVAELARVSLRVAQRAIGALAEVGLITMTKRNDEEGHRISNLYQFHDGLSVARYALGEVPMRSMRRPKASCAAPQSVAGDVAEVDPLSRSIKKNQYLFPNLLSEVIAEWNVLGPSVGPPIRNPLRPPKALLEVYKRIERDGELREAFSDLPAIMAAIRKAKYCHRQPWFTLPWIFTRDKETKELRVHRILNGVYDNGSNGKRVSDERFTGQVNLDSFHS